MKTGFMIEVFSQNNCAACKQVKELLSKRNLIYTSYEIDNSPAAREDFFKRLPAARTVPQVFIDNRHIGGLDDLVKELYHNDYF